MFYGTGINISGEVTPSRSAADTSKVYALEGRVKDLERHVERLALLNQALWEMLQEKVRWSDRDLEAKAQEVDMRDGVTDGKMTARAVRCPSCERVCNSKHGQCMYCGQQFEKPIFG